MKYDVHVFTVVRVSVEAVEAESHEEAIKTAIDRVNFSEIFDKRLSSGMGPSYTEWAEEDVYYLVDECGDEEYGNSRWWSPGKDGSVVPM